MKTKEKFCERCEEETIHDVGKKQAHKRDTHYTRRKTSRCRKCGTREIINRRTDRRIVGGKNIK